MKKPAKKDVNFEDIALPSFDLELPDFAPLEIPDITLDIPDFALEMPGAQKPEKPDKRKAQTQKK